ILLELFEGGVADDAAIHRLIAFNRMRPAAVAAMRYGAMVDVMAFGDGNLVGVTRLAQAWHPHKQRRIGAANGIGVIAEATTNSACAGASLSERQRNGVIRMA